MNKDELALIKSCQDGNSEAFGQLYDQYAKQLYNFIYYKTHHRETAEDILSTVFFKALRKIDSFSGENFSSWLYKIARNTVIDYYRTKKENLNIEDAWDLAEKVDTHNQLDAKLKLEKLKKYLKNLKADQRDIVIMRVWQEMPYKEIAEVLGKNEANCKMIFSRAIKKLRKEMPLELFILFILNL